MFQNLYPCYVILDSLGGKLAESITPYRVTHVTLKKFGQYRTLLKSAVNRTTLDFGLDAANVDRLRLLQSV